MSLPVDMVCFGEDRAHWETAVAWCDTLLRSEVDWLADHEDLTVFRRWLVDSESARNQLKYLKYSRRRGFGAGPRYHGKFAGVPGEADARQVSECLTHVRHVLPSVRCVVMMRDTDNQMNRRTGAAQAIAKHRDTQAAPLLVVLGYATPEVEAWHVAVTEVTPQRRDAHDNLRQKLGFDPVEKPEKLSSSKESKAEAKAVAAQLDVSGWRATPAAKLRQVAVSRGGAACGLGGFVAEVIEQLVPLVNR